VTELNLEAGRAIFEEVTGRTQPDQWPGLSDVAKQSWAMRAAGELRFIPSRSTAVRHKPQKIVNPIPEPEVPARLIAASDALWEDFMPGGAKQIVKLAANEGWSVAVSYCKGPWTMQTEHEESDEGDDVLTKYGQADSVLVRGWSTDRHVHGKGRSFAAMWLRKPWTLAGQKPATKQGAGGYQLEYAQIRPRPDYLDNGKVSSDHLKLFIKGEEIPEP
jgi:hypothetical protein